MASLDEVESVLQRLRQRGGRVTQTRRVTVEVLFEGGHSHLSAEDVVIRVKSRMPEIAESTVYRTLSVLEECGVVEQIHLGERRSTYHLAKDAHQHLVCDRCAAVVEIPDAELVPLAERLNSVYGFRIHPHYFAIVGECRRCQKQQRRQAQGAGSA